MEISWEGSWLFAVVTTFFAIFLLISRYGLSALLHPFLIFLMTWLLSLFSFGLGIRVGLKSFLITNEYYLTQLFNIIGFTGSTMVIILLLTSKNPKKGGHFRWSLPEWFLKPYAYAFAALGLISIASRGLDVASNRLAEIEKGYQIALASDRPGILGVIIGVLLFLKMPILIYNGKQFFSMYFEKSITFKPYVLFVLIGGSLEVISLGGRSGIAEYLILFGLGFLIAHLKSNSLTDWSLLKNGVRFFLPISLIFLFYVNFVSSARAKHGNYINVTQEYFSKTSVGRNFFGIMEYSIFHISGYQLRMMDTATDELEGGQYTFQFITRYNLPVFTQALGQEFNLAKLLDLKTQDTRLGTLKAQKMGLAAASTTASVFFVLNDDYGYPGLLIVVALFSLFTHYVFTRLFKRNINSFWSIIIYLFLFDLWRQSWFSHHLNGTIFNQFLYSAIFLSIISRLKI